ncbi:MAG: TIGR03905 family TSCPD domain-containing protein [Staphylococcus sp.]|nr:TIGR03905 family TSCPD domain-containing protein [Staphylococcus sp.]
MSKSEIMKYHYTTCGTCSREIVFEVENGLIGDVCFTGGCHGNLQGIASLVRGMKVEDVVARLEGIRCGNKPTSCPDQLANALRGVMAKEQ